MHIFFESCTASELASSSVSINCWLFFFTSRQKECIFVKTRGRIRQDTVLITMLAPRTLCASSFAASRGRSSRFGTLPPPPQKTRTAAARLTGLGGRVVEDNAADVRANHPRGFRKMCAFAARAVFRPRNDYCCRRNRALSSAQYRGSVWNSNGPEPCGECMCYSGRVIRSRQRFSLVSRTRARSSSGFSGGHFFRYQNTSQAPL